MRFADTEPVGDPGAKLIGSRVVEVVEDLDRLLPGAAGGVAVYGCLVSIAEVSKEIGAGAQLPAPPDGMRPGRWRQR
jgi:hypothetical protein